MAQVNTSSVLQRKPIKIAQIEMSVLVFPELTDDKNYIIYTHIQKKKSQHMVYSYWRIKLQLQQADSNQPTMVYLIIKKDHKQKIINCKDLKPLLGSTQHRQTKYRRNIELNKYRKKILEKIIPTDKLSKLKNVKLKISIVEQQRNKLSKTLTDQLGKADTHNRQDEPTQLSRNKKDRS